jgi:hypothetical protein
MSVDSRVFHTTLPLSLATQIGIKTYTYGPMTSGGPNLMMSLAYIKLLDREGAIPVVVRPDALPVLGFSTLQCLGLKVNEAAHQLDYDRPYGPAMMGVRHG